jgi:hypothetical protein
VLVYTQLLRFSCNLRRLTASVPPPLAGRLDAAALRELMLDELDARPRPLRLRPLTRGLRPSLRLAPRARRASAATRPATRFVCFATPGLRLPLRARCSPGSRVSLGGRGFAPHPAAGCLGNLRSPFGDALRQMAPPRPSPLEGSGASAVRLFPAFGGPRCTLKILVGLYLGVNFERG